VFTANDHVSKFCSGGRSPAVSSFSRHPFFAMIGLVTDYRKGIRHYISTVCIDELGRANFFLRRSWSGDEVASSGVADGAYWL